MKLVLMSVGKTQYQPFREAIQRYADRLQHYVPFEIKELPDAKNTRSLSEQQQKEQEASAILNSLQNGDWLMLLDERGKEYTSKDFAKLLGDKMMSLPGRLVFLIGGPYGFSQRVYDRANGMFALSRLTFPHELAKLLTVEQLYRAQTILRNESYHHE